MLRVFQLTLALASCTAAHFVLDWPPNAGFDDASEPNAPCGGFDVSISKDSTAIQVDRFAASITVAHPVGEFAFRATTDTAPPYDFVDITPLINSTGLGTFCVDYLFAPSSFAGKQGVLQVVDNSPDGILYQCAPVNFVSGSNSTVGSSCSNSSAVSVAWILGSDDFAANTTSSGTTTSAAASSSMSGAASAMTVAVGAYIGGIGVVAAGLMI